MCIRVSRCVQQDEEAKKKCEPKHQEEKDGERQHCGPAEDGERLQPTTMRDACRSPSRTRTIRGSAGAMDSIGQDGRRLNWIRGMVGEVGEVGDDDDDDAANPVATILRVSLCRSCSRHRAQSDLVGRRSMEKDERDLAWTVDFPAFNNDDPPKSTDTGQPLASMNAVEPVIQGSVLIKTTIGDIKLELWGREAPKAVRK